GTPRFTSQPTAATVHQGSSHVMPCEVNADLAPFARWEKDRQPLELGARLIQLPSGALVISNASEGDAGLYRCLLENVGSSKSSDEAQLHVVPEPGQERKLEFLLEPVSVTKVLGATALLPCVVTGYPAPHVRWMLGDKLVEESDTFNQLCSLPTFERGYVLAPTPRLVFSSTSAEVEEEQTCAASARQRSDQWKHQESLISPVAVDVKAERLNGCPVELSRGGSLARFPSVSYRFPSSQLGLFLFHSLPPSGPAGETQSEGRVEVLGGASLQISNLTEEDAGVYTCMADSANGTIEAQAQLSVQVGLVGNIQPVGVPPQFVRRPANIYAHESMDIVFECEVSGSPAPSVKWVKNGDAVIPSDYFKIVKEHNLQVLGLVKSDEGFYQCLAENEAGNIQSSAQLIILDH
ncbi:unnamed protein product, partial [Tetraodon nigroviridis]